MSSVAQVESLSGAAVGLLRDGIDRLKEGDTSGYTCLSVAEVLFRQQGDEWNAGLASQWRRFQPSEG